MSRTTTFLHISHDLTHGVPACLHDSRLTCLIESVRSQSDQPGRQAATDAACRAGKRILLLLANTQLLQFTESYERTNKVHTWISCSTSSSEERIIGRRQKIPSPVFEVSLMFTLNRGCFYDTMYFLYHCTQLLFHLVIQAVR